MRILLIVMIMMAVYQNVFMMMVGYHIVQYHDHHHDEQVPGNDSQLHSPAKIKFFPVFIESCLHVNDQLKLYRLKIPEL